MSSISSIVQTDSKQTNFQAVDTFNKTFGLPTFQRTQTDIFDKDPKLVSLRLDLIKEEVRELEEAIQNKDMVETIDALADILYVVYGAGSSFGVDLDKAFDLVHKSNMTKACPSEKEAKATVEWYKKNELRYDSPTYRKSDTGDYWVVYNESTGKILKWRHYQAVDLTCFVDK